MISAPLLPALRLFRDFQTGDVDARDEVHELFPPDAECFICDQPVGTDPGLYVGEDPRDKNLAVVAPLCATCMSLTFQVRLHRIRMMMQSMWPAVRHRVNVAPMSALRRLG
jgi:hypothetical protein